MTLKDGDGGSRYRKLREKIEKREITFAEVAEVKMVKVKKMFPRLPKETVQFLATIPFEEMDDFLKISERILEFKDERLGVLSKIERTILNMKLDEHLPGGSHYLDGYQDDV